MHVDIRRYATNSLKLKPELVEQLIADQFPSLSNAKATFLKEGCDSAAYEIGKSLIFRFPKRQEVEQQLDRELSLLPKLKSCLPAPIPRFAYIGKPSSEFPWKFVGYERIPGQFVRTLQIDSEGERRLAKDLGQFLTKLHSFSVAGNQFDLPIGAENPCECLQTLDKNKTTIQQVTGATAFEVFRKVLLESVEKWAPYVGTLRLIHTDFVSEHILAEPADFRLSGVIDWGDVQIGDPAIDLGGLYHWRGRAFANAVLEHYGLPWDEAFLERARLFAASVGIDDLLWGLETRKKEYLESGINALRHVTAAATEPTHPAPFARK